LSLPIRFEEWLEKKEKSRREAKIRPKLRNREWYRYQPTETFQSPLEVGRTFWLEFQGKPDRIDFFVNTNVSPSPLNNYREGTSLKKDAVLLKVISSYLSEPTDKTTTGKLIRLGNTIDGNISEFINDYRKRRLKNFEEKEEFYYKMRLWNAQIMPFVTMIQSLKNENLNGKLDDVKEYQQFKQEVRSKQNAIMPLENLLIAYNERTKPFAPEPIQARVARDGDFKAYGGKKDAYDTECFMKAVGIALEAYKDSEGKGEYPDDLNLIVKEGFIEEMRNDYWGVRFRYRKTQNGYELLSFGIDCKKGTEDDIVIKKP
jgi:hypothetical protein